MEDTSHLTSRSLEIFKELVDAYIETGEAVGSRLLSKRSQFALSSATIRNIMADLEEMGLLYAPHTSAGRIPTESGLRYFINGLLECTNFEQVDSRQFEELLQTNHSSIQSILEQATALLSGLSECAGVVLAPRMDSILKRIEFVSINAKQILVIMVSQNGQVENRIIPGPLNIDSAQLQQISNYLSERLEGKTLADGLALMERELHKERNHFDELTSQLLKQGLEVWKTSESEASLILKGQANLLENIEEIEEVKNIQHLFDALDTKLTMVSLLDSVAKADGIQVFIGSENPYFNVAGCSLIISPYRSADKRIIGAIGVIGPAHMKYRRIIPLVDYTSKIVSKLLGGHSSDSNV